MNLIKILLRLFQKPTPQILGALEDNRSDEEKAQDWRADEIIATAAPVNWVEMKPSAVRSFGVQNQDGSGSCVAQSRRKLYRILFKVNRGLDLDFSASYIYRHRFNYPAPGMSAADAIKISREGITLEALLKSDNLNDAQMNAVKIEDFHREIAKVFRTPHEVIFTPGDMETVASTIQKTRKGVMVWFFFTAAEWSKEVPVILQKPFYWNSPGVLRHSVVAVEPALYNGKKGLWIEDSAHFSGINRRFITEEFYKARNMWASYPINFVFESDGNTDPSKPTYTFTRDVYFSTTFFKDPDVVVLQNILKYEGLFPLNVDSTGYLGAITRKAIQASQQKLGVPMTGNLDAPYRAALNARYAK